MALAVAFAMIAAYFLSRTFVPACSARWLRPHAAHDTSDDERAADGPARAFARLGGADRPGHRRLRPGCSMSCSGTACSPSAWLSA